MFHPLVSSWFERRYGSPTDIQARAWPEIAAGGHVLVAAPTGSGKTMTAFLHAIDRMITDDVSSGGVRVLYISPLKALNNDIRRNLLAPLEELKEEFLAACMDFPPVNVSVRSGDTPPEERRRMLKRPPEILITTPESLNILLTSAGGGASGLIAACFAAGGGISVTLYEKESKIGRKLLITGNGRCNISNRNASADHYHGENPRFVNNVLSRFSVDDTEAFFSELGIPFVEEDEGRLYPASLQASVVPKMFQYRLKKLGVDLRLNRRIDSMKKSGDEFILVTAGHEEHRFEAVILSAGSCAYPSLGAGMWGYDLARSMGHRIIEPWPVILPINITPKILHTLQGIKNDVSARVLVDETVIASASGELLFTAYGISGPASLALSRAVNGALREGRKPLIEIDLLPRMSPSELKDCLDGLWADGERKAGFSLLGILKERAPDVICRMAGVDPEKRVSSLGGRERDSIASMLKGLRLEPGASRGFKEAVAAAGGVAVDEIHTGTMESRKTDNLFITGELLDIDGDSGGYNLQFAWSSGAAAGMALRLDS
jgi:predicted Rossmann fold flavoprotein